MWGMDKKPRRRFVRFIFESYFFVNWHGANIFLNWLSNFSAKTWYIQLNSVRVCVCVCRHRESNCFSIPFPFTFATFLRENCFIARLCEHVNTAIIKEKFTRIFHCKQRPWSDWQKKMITHKVFTTEYNLFTISAKPSSSPKKRFPFFYEYTN